MVDCQTAPIYALVCLLVALVLSVLAIAGGIVGCCALGCCGEQSNKKESRLEAAVPGAGQTARVSFDTSMPTTWDGACSRKAMAVVS